MKNIEYKKKKVGVFL